MTIDGIRAVSIEPTEHTTFNICHSMAGKAVIFQFTFIYNKFAKETENRPKNAEAKIQTNT